MQPAVLAINIFLIQNPADALNRAALELAFDIVGLDGFAGVLNDRVTADVGFAGFLIDLCIDDMHAETGTCTRRIGREMTRDRPTRAPHPLGDFL